MKRAFRRITTPVLALVLLASTVQAQERDRTRRSRDAEAAPTRQAVRAAQTDRAAAPSRPSRRGPALAPDAQVRVIVVKHADAESIANVINHIQRAGGIGGGSALVISDERTNALIVATKDDDAIETIQELVAALDTTVAALDTTWEAKQPARVKTELIWHAVPLKAARAHELVDALGQLASVDRRTPVRIVADERANTVWLSGPDEHVAKLATVAREMDANTGSAETRGPTGQRALHFFSLEHARSGPLAGTVSLVARMMDLDVEVVSDQQSDTIVAYATPDQLEQLKSIIAELDVAPKRPRGRRPAGESKD